MNMRAKGVIPTIITRNRRRGTYAVAATIKAKSITKDKALALGNAIDQAMRDLGLVGIASLKYIIKGSKSVECL